MTFEIAFYWAIILFSIFSIGWGVTVSLSASIAHYIEDKEDDQ